MVTRRACQAGSFYPSDETSCRQQIKDCLGTYQPPAEPEHPVAGIVPHAGWVFSGPTAAKVFKSIYAKTSPATVLIFGAIHVREVSQAALFPEGDWETPCGKVAIDQKLADLLLHELPDLVTADSAAHRGEHSIEVQIPFLQYLFPTINILPIMVPPDQNAPILGEKIAQLLPRHQKSVFVLGSTDLTHYGPRFWFTPFGQGNEALAKMKANDERIIDLATHMNAAEVILEAEQHHNACGAGAIAATVAAASVLGATQGYLLEHTTSQDVMPERRATDFVGYAGIIF